MTFLESVGDSVGDSAGGFARDSAGGPVEFWGDDLWTAESPPPRPRTPSGHDDLMCLPHALGAPRIFVEHPAPTHGTVPLQKCFPSKNVPLPASFWGVQLSGRPAFRTGNRTFRLLATKHSSRQVHLVASRRFRFTAISHFLTPAVWLS